METFDTSIKKDDAGRLTIIEIPFNAKERFCKPKGTIYVGGTINGAAYRGKLLSRGGGKYVMVLDKALQKTIGFDGRAMNARVTMVPEDLEPAGKNNQRPAAAGSGMDVLTAIETRQSIRKFAPGPVGEDVVTAILCCGLYAPTAKNKRPCHFVLIRDKPLLSRLAARNPQAAMLADAAGAVVVCGDRNVEGIKAFLYADCAAAAQNILLGIHGLGLGGVWCGVAPDADWRKLIIAALQLPAKLEPVAVIAFGWPDEEKELSGRWEPAKIHYEKW